jgi:hypothetical protein
VNEIEGRNELVREKIMANLRVVETSNDEDEFN